MKEREKGLFMEFPPVPHSTPREKERSQKGKKSVAASSKRGKGVEKTNLKGSKALKVFRGKGGLLSYQEGGVPTSNSRRNKSYQFEERGGLAWSVWLGLKRIGQGDIC